MGRGKLRDRDRSGRRGCSRPEGYGLSTRCDGDPQGLGRQPSRWPRHLVTSGVSVFHTAGVWCRAAGPHGPALLCPLPFPSRALGQPAACLPWAVPVWSWQPQHTLPWRRLPGLGGEGALVGTWNPCPEREGAYVSTSISELSKTVAPPESGEPRPRGRGLLQGCQS